MSARRAQIDVEHLVGMLEHRLNGSGVAQADDVALAPYEPEPVSEQLRRYRLVIESVRARASQLDPGVVAVVTKGDPELLTLGRPAWHFPQTDDGRYAGHHPVDGADVIERLGRVQERGARYLVLPETAYWWLTHYPDLSTHLDANARLVESDDDLCRVYDLAPRAARSKKRKRADEPALPSDARLQELCRRAMLEDPDLAAIFDAGFYLDAYPDVAETGLDPLVHYLAVGALERRDPGPLFDTSFYLSEYPDVAAAGVNPLLHYLSPGAAEGRLPNRFFDTQQYMRDHGAVMGRYRNALAHFVASQATVRLLEKSVIPYARRIWGPFVKQVIHSICRYPTDGAGGLAYPSDGPGVVVASHDAEVNGAQLIALSVARELKDRGVEPLMVVLHRGGPLLEQFAAIAPTVVLDSARGEAPGAFDDLVMMLKELGIDAALCNTVVTGDLAARFKANGMKVVSMIHELPYAVRTYASPALLEQSVAGSDHLVFPARIVRDRLLEEFSLEHESVTVHSQGILRANPFLDERAFARLQITKELDIPEDSVIVMGCGLASERKGFDLFAELAQTVSERMARPYHFVWVGAIDGHTGFTDRALEDARARGALDHLHITGLREHPGLYYVGSDLFVLTSREDPFPTVCMEAMEAGLPVIAFDDAGGIGELVTSDTGAFVPHLDVAAMADAVVTLGEDERRRKKLGKRGRAAVADLTVDTYTGFLLGLIGHPLRPAAVNGHARGVHADAR